MRTMRMDEAATRGATLLCTVAVAAVAAVGATARADEPATMAKADVESMIGGKKIAYLRKRDGTTVTWDFRSGGDVYYTTPNTIRNTGFPGTYTVEDDGAVCFKWRPDKYLAMQDGCVRFVRDGETVHIVGQRNPSNVLGDVVP